MFGKKIPNPQIEELEKIFGERVMPVLCAHSESFVRLEYKQFIGLAKMSRNLIMKRDFSSYGYIEYSLIGPDGYLYFTEVMEEVKA